MLSIAFLTASKNSYPLKLRCRLLPFSFAENGPASISQYYELNRLMTTKKLDSCNQKSSLQAIEYNTVTSILRLGEAYS